MMVCLSAGAYFILRSLQDEVVFYLTPTELLTRDPATLHHIRIGGLVEKNSLKYDGPLVNFTITDLKNKVTVTYQGVTPALFAEGKGVVAEGEMQSGKLQATRILAKHDENYTPPKIPQ